LASAPSAFRAIDLHVPDEDLRLRLFALEIAIELPAEPAYLPEQPL